MRLEYNAGVVISGIIAYVFGGWNLALQTLLGLMILDYITGLYVAATAKSKKTKKGKLSPRVALLGVCKKVIILLICGMSYRLDVLMNAEGLLYNVVCLFYIGNEGLSVLDNANKAEVKLPKKLKIFLNSIMEDAEDES